jgi:hypothetical protein
MLINKIELTRGQLHALYRLFNGPMTSLKVRFSLGARWNYIIENLVKKEFISSKWSSHHESFIYSLTPFGKKWIEENDPLELLK